MVRRLYVTDSIMSANAALAVLKNLAFEQLNASYTLDHLEFTTASSVLVTRSWML